MSSALAANSSSRRTWETTQDAGASSPWRAVKSGPLPHPEFPPCLCAHVRWKKRKERPRPRCPVDAVSITCSGEVCTEVRCFVLLRLYHLHLLFSRQVVSGSLRPHGRSSPSPGVHPSSFPLNQWCCEDLEDPLPFHQCPRSQAGLFHSHGSPVLQQGRVVLLSGCVSWPSSRGRLSSLALWAPEPTRGLFSLPRLYLASPLNGTRRPQVSGVLVTPGSHLGKRMVYLPPQEAHHLNPAVSASWQPPQRPSPQETKQILSPEFPCFFSSKSPVATKLQLRGRIKGTGGLWGCGTHTELCPFLTLCFLWPAASVFVPLGAQVSEGGAKGRQVRVGGASLQTAPDSKSLPTDRTTNVRWKAVGVPRGKELVGFLSTLHHSAARLLLVRLDNHDPMMRADHISL